MKPSETACDDESNKTSSSAQSTVASIDDVLIQILLCIPLKPLFRLKLVSKHWNFIISDKKFNLLRNQKSPNPAVGLIFKFGISLHLANTSTSLVSFDKPTNGPLFRTLKFNSNHEFIPLSSCNGLLLCQRIFDKDTFDPNQRYCVCNPTTNKYFTLPKLDKPAYCIDSMSLSFDPSNSPHYKVVCVRKMSSNRNQLDVYSSETRYWREHGDPFSADVDFSRGVYWNGAIHWISKTSTGKSLYFNPDNDQVPRVMPTPPMDTHLIMPCFSSWSCNSSCFGESCGHLHYMEEDKAVTELNVYEMRTDYSEWFLKYRVDCSLIGNRSVTRLCALIRGKKEKDEDSFLVWGSETKIIRHNLVYKTRETIYEILDAASARFFPTWEHPLQYIESLSHV